MWTSTNFNTFKKKFDFSSSGQGKPTLTVLKIDDTEFVNMIESLDGEIEEDQIFQTIICSSCGIHHCEQGNWVALRQFDDFVFFIPAFEELHGVQNQTEYAPPYWLKQKGSFWLSKADFEKFKKLVPAIDVIKSIKRLSKAELLALYKSETPQELFGRYPSFNSLKSSRLIAVSELEIETVIEIIDRKLKDLEIAKDFEMQKLSDNDKLLTVFLDDTSLTEWKALSITQDNYELLIGGTFKIKTR